MVLCTKSAALAKCTSCFKGLLRPWASPNNDCFGEGEIHHCPEGDRKSPVGVTGRVGWRAQEVLISEICPNTAPAAAFEARDYISLMKSGGISRGKGFLLTSDCPPPAAIASLVLIHLLKPWQQPGLKCRLKMFTCSEVKEQLRTKSRTRHAVAFEIGRVGSMWLRSRE